MSDELEADLGDRIAPVTRSVASLVPILGGPRAEVVTGAGHDIPGLREPDATTLDCVHAAIGGSKMVYDAQD